MIEFNASTCFSINPEVMHTPVGDESVLMAIESEALYGVNGVGTQILKQLELQPMSLQAMSDFLLRCYDVDAEQGQADIECFFKSLLAEKLIIAVEA